MDRVFRLFTTDLVFLTRTIILIGSLALFSASCDSETENSAQADLSQRAAQNSAFAAPSGPTPPAAVTATPVSTAPPPSGVPPRVAAATPVVTPIATPSPTPVILKTPGGAALAAAPPVSSGSQICFVFTGSRRSELEPCGCHGKQTGGVDREAHLYENLKKAYADLIRIETGNWTAFMTPNDRLKTDHLIKSLKALEFDVYNVTPYDIAFGTTHPLQLQEGKGRLVAANLLVQVGDGRTTRVEAPFPPYTILERKTTTGRPIRVGVIGLTDPGSLEPLLIQFMNGLKTTPRYQITDVKEAIKKYVPEVREKADYVVVVMLMDRKHAPLMAQIVQGIDMLVTTWGVQTSMMNLEIGKTNIANTGFLGRYFNQQIVNFDSQSRPVKVAYSLQDIPSDGQKVASVTRILDDYKEATKLLASQIQKDKADSRWVGRNRCLNCHRNEYMQWVRTPHNQAYTTLVAKRQQYNPDCLKCHVVAFEEKDGYIPADVDSMHLVSVQCENCHGPGRDHVTSMTLVAPKLAAGEEVDRSAFPRMIVTPSEELCAKCHDPDHSPDFSYAKDMALVSHKNMAGPWTRAEWQTSATVKTAMPPVDFRQLKPNPPVPIQ